MTKRGRPTANMTNVLLLDYRTWKIIYDAWLEKQIENNVLIEQKTGFLKFLVDFGGIGQ